MTKFFSAFDVENVLLRKKSEKAWHNGITGISVYYDAAVIRIKSDEVKDEVVKLIKSWLGQRYSEKDNKIFLESPFNGEKRFLEVSFDIEPEEDGIVSKIMKPSFADFGIYPDNPDLDGPDFDKIKGLPEIWAFYSFKGGVSRTIHLLSLVKALSERKPPKRVLIVDADLEAPGLTWWAKEQLGTFEISFLDFLALAHYDESDNHVQSLSMTEERLRQQMLTLRTKNGTIEHFFLPAFREVDQLLRMSVRPENLVWESGKQWIMAELLYSLGKRLEADIVIVDLRAGLSELSSPLLFDPRVNRVIVTTPSSQSVEGTKLILEQSRKVASVLKKTSKDYEAYAPMVILSMIKEDLKDTAEIENIKEELSNLVISEDSDENSMIGKVYIRTSLFDENLLFLKNLDNTLEKLDTSNLHRQMAGIADRFRLKYMINSPVFAVISEYYGILEILKNTLEKYEFAESGECTGFLPVLPLKQLAHKFQYKLPAAVIMGAKGSGKTFTYIQLARCQLWNNFLNVFGLNSEKDIHLLPLISSRNLGTKAKKTVTECWEYAKQSISSVRFNPIDKDEIRKRIDEFHQSGASTETEWKNFWLKVMADSLSCGQSENHIEAMQNLLSQSGKKIVFQIDGLEDYFQYVNQNIVEQAAIRSLCQGIPEELRDTVNSNIGILVFIRKDLIQAAIRQNFGQFESLYKSFELKWDWVEAIRLVAWLLNTVDELKNDFHFKSVEKASQEELEASLEPLWGLKLGKPDSKEANTVNWVIAALSDFNG
ncbi:MAG TPA: hypothetical protein DCQ37_10540, partial [Desulfobacteraceae bacterium]|nr:hypothetical protein [Desulfobacteraceae bacterium]